MEVQLPHQSGTMPKEFPMESFNQSIINHKTGLLNLAAVSWIFPEIPYYYVFL